MDFQIGEKVVHWNYGIGEITLIENQLIHDHQAECYVVRTRDLMIWVPIDDTGECSLRTPTPAEAFPALFTILKSAPEPLLDDRLSRKNQLMDLLRTGDLAAICQVIRDLHGMSKTGKLNEQDKSIMERSRHFLAAEWSYSLGLTQAQAEQALDDLLHSIDN